MNYSFHQLRIFSEVVKQKSISKAADKLRMTQPALSINNFFILFLISSSYWTRTNDPLGVNEVL